MFRCEFVTCVNVLIEKKKRQSFPHESTSLPSVIPRNLCHDVCFCIKLQAYSHFTCTELKFVPVIKVKQDSVFFR